MPQLLLATNNAGKVAEYRSLLAGHGWEVVTPKEIGVELPDDESGETYEENARMKALRGAELSGLMTLADDSGIEIEAMGGEPGVHSARFMGREASYEERFAEILRRLDGVLLVGRGARFRCVIAIADPLSGDVRTTEGEVSGSIADKPRGDWGFGYDPIFWVPTHSTTMAHLPAEIKNMLSHRAMATVRAREILKEMLQEKLATDEHR